MRNFQTVSCFVPSLLTIDEFIDKTRRCNKSKVPYRHSNQIIPVKPQKIKVNAKHKENIFDFFYSNHRIRYFPPMSKGIFSLVTYVSFGFVNQNTYPFSYLHFSLFHRCFLNVVSVLVLTFVT